MTHKPIKFATFKALGFNFSLFPKPGEMGENCVNFEIRRGSKHMQNSAVNRVNFGQTLYEKACVMCVNFAVDPMLKQVRP
ncbi:hypothetical protein GCM10009096_28080 [Parasphingorhabdus litoris]|uniref:Uncharacterized protein n=1 Tax=Parasphingorhabdus litoris TaxID=394733 RepID=A0ABP3KNU9_9SPHN|nr:hypothetical protein [Parasphingorhabdus litoris]